MKAVSVTISVEILVCISLAVASRSLQSHLMFIVALNMISRVVNINNQDGCDHCHYFYSDSYGTILLFQSIELWVLAAMA